MAPPSARSSPLVLRDVYSVDYAPTDRAKCKGCQTTLHKGTVRFGRKVRSPWHDGFDTQYRHFNCGFHYVKHPNEIFGLLDLQWSDVQRFYNSLSHTVATYQKRNHSLWELKTKLLTLPMSYMLPALECNSMLLDERIKQLEAATLVADGILFGKLPRCPICDNFSLRQSGAIVYCLGYVESSNSRCQFTYILHDLYDPDSPPNNRAAEGIEPSDLERKAPFILPAILINAPILGGWKYLDTIGRVTRPQLEEKREATLESDLQSESETEDRVPEGKELLGLKFASVGFTPDEKKNLQCIIEDHGGQHTDKVSVGVTFILISDKVDDMKHSKLRKDIMLWDIPVLHHSYVNALVSRKRKPPPLGEPQSKRCRFPVDAQLPSGLILRQRKYIKYYLKGGQLPRYPYPTVQALLANQTSKEAVEKSRVVLKRPPVAAHAAVLTVDPWFDGHPHYRVYVDEDNNVYNCTTLFTDITTGINKYYNQQLLHLRGHNGVSSFRIFRRWGRVGADDKTTNDFLNDSFGNDMRGAKAAFEKRAHELTGIPWNDRESVTAKPGRYHYVFLDDQGAGIPSTSVPLPPCTLSAALRSLIELVFDQQMIDTALESQNIDISKMALGTISQHQIAEGYRILESLEQLLLPQQHSNGYDRHNVFLVHNSPKWLAKITAYTTQFYSAIPHSFPVERTPPLLNTIAKLRQKIFLIEHLMDISVTRSIMKHANIQTVAHPLNAYYDALNCQITPLYSDSELEVLDAYEFHRESDRNRFQDFLGLIGDSKRQMLWHGSRTTNFASILKLGLRVAPKDAPKSGYMFGKGIYFADMVSKAARYCYATPTNPYGLIVLCEVVLGSGLLCFQANADAEKACTEKGKLHAWGVGHIVPKRDDVLKFTSAVDSSTVPFAVGHGVPQQFDSKEVGVSGTPHLLYNEYIVYNSVRFKFKTLGEGLSSASTSSSDEEVDNTLCDVT